MQEKLTSEKRNLFCKEFIQSMNPIQAAQKVGQEDGFVLLRDQRVEKQLGQMRKIGLPTRQDVLRRLGQLAFGQTLDLGQLIEQRCVTKGMDLSCVTELKMTDKGMELKLIDQLDALQTLWNLLEENEDSGMTQFLETLKTSEEKGNT